MNQRQVVARVALLGAHDTGGHRVVESEGRADGDHPFADLEAIDITHLHGRQTGRVDLHDSNVGALVGAHDLGLELALVGQRDDDFVRAFDHVRIGHDVAVGAQDEARAHAARLFFLLLWLAAARLARLLGAVGDWHAETAEELEHVLVHAIGRIAGSHALGGANVHHGRADLIHQIREVGQAARCRCGLRLHGLHCGQRCADDCRGHECERVALQCFLTNPQHQHLDLTRYFLYVSK